MSRILWLGLAAAFAACSIPNTAFHASPDGNGGDDSSANTIVLSTSTLSVPEGSTGTFDVSLMYDPGTTATVTLTTNPMGLPLDKPTITFTSASFAAPVSVRVSPPIDSNATSEMTTITASGAGASTPSTLTVTTTDSTVIKQYGFPMPFTPSASLGLGQMIAIKITTNETTMLDSFGVYIPAGSGDFRMAVYADGVNAPGALVAAMPVRQAITNGINIGNIADVSLPIGTYWLAFRAAQTTAVGLSSVGTGPECVGVLNISNLDTPWPAPFGSANCSADNFLNFFITTYHQ